MKLHIGCGRQRLPAEDGWVNCDLTPGVADAVFDCQEAWPFPESTATLVMASHVFEHLERPMDFLAHAWRVLMPMGAVHLRMPYGGHRSAWWDHTHLRPWFPENFACLQPGYHRYNGNPQHGEAGKQTPYGIQNIAIRISRNTYALFQDRKLKKILKPLLHNLVDIGEEMFVDLFALKREEDIEQYALTRPEPFIVPITYVAYKHHTEGHEDVPPGDPVTLMSVLETIGLQTYHGKVYKVEG